MFVAQGQTTELAESCWDLRERKREDPWKSQKWIARDIGIPEDSKKAWRVPWAT